MVGNHSLYKSEKKWKNASSEAKSVSSFQRKINALKKELDRLIFLNKLKKIQLSNFSKLNDYLIDNNKVTKEEIKKFLATKKQTILNIIFDKIQQECRRNCLVKIQNA